MIDPRETSKSVGRQARRAQRTATRLAFSAIGFSAAYFLDPEHGASRRRQALQLLRRGQRAIVNARGADVELTLAEEEALDLDERANGSRAAVNGLKIAR
jgi:hypothetical protein